MISWEAEAEQDKALDTFRERIIWMHAHESMMWEFYRRKAAAIPRGTEYGPERWERQDAERRGEAAFRTGQGFMEAWKEINELQAGLHRAHTAERQAK